MMKSTEEQDFVRKAEQAIARLPRPKPISPKLRRSLWDEQQRQNGRVSAWRFKPTLQPLWLSITVVACMVLVFFVYNNYTNNDSMIQAGFVPAKPMGSAPPAQSEPFRAVHLRRNGVLDYTVSYQTKDGAVDTKVYLLRQGRLERAAVNLFPTQSSSSELTFHGEVKDLYNPSSAGALQQGWQKLIIVLALKGRQPGAGEILERIHAPLLKKTYKWTYLEYEISIVD